MLLQGMVATAEPRSTSGGGGGALPSPEGERMTRGSTTAASKDKAALGHQATHCMTPPNVQVRVHLPVRTSHRRTVPSSEAEASHCPEESGDMLRTYTPENKAYCIVYLFDCNQ